LGPLYRLLENKYYFDTFNEKVLVPAGRGIGRFFWQVGDVRIIDGFFVNGSAYLIGWISSLARRLQTGFLYHYAFAMVIGLTALLAWLILR